jgi:hypothetical protein
MTFTRSGFFKTIAAACMVPAIEVAKPEVRPPAPAPKLYAIEYPGCLTGEAYQNLSNSLKPIGEKHDCTFIVLEEGARLSDGTKTVYFRVDGAESGAESRIAQAVRAAMNNV